MKSFSNFAVLNRHRSNVLHGSVINKKINTPTKLKIMLAKVSQIGTSVGVIIPRYIATEGGFTKGSPVNIEFSDDKIIISKPRTARQGWADAFARYTMEGEDEMLLPDCLDSEAVDLI